MNLTDNHNILSLINNTPDIVLKGIAERVKTRRLELALTQAELAKRSDMPLSTYRRFERFGKVSLEALVRIGFALGAEDDFAGLFAAKAYGSLDELLDEKKRKRGKRK